MKFYVEGPRVVRYDIITDSLTTSSYFNYANFPKSIKKTVIHSTDTKKEFYSWFAVYDLNENFAITKMTQYLNDLTLVMDYSYDMEGHLSMIYFANDDNHCKWLWRDGNLESIVWGDGERVTHFRYDPDRFLPFGSCFVELPKLDIALSMMGFYGVNPEQAFVLQAEVEDEDVTDLSQFVYLAEKHQLPHRQIRYLGLGTDSIDYNIVWGKTKVQL